jgi:opacity protein-like surface antigen
MRTPIVTFVAVSLFVLAPRIAGAQAPTEAGGAWLLSPSIGLGLDPDADASLTLGGALGYPLTRTLAVEGELGHAFDLAPDDADVDSSLTTVHGTLLFFFPTGFELTAYAAGGLGVAKFRHDVSEPPDSIDSTELGFNLGGGVTFPLNGAVWIRGDVRMFKHIDDVPTIWRFAGGLTVRLRP